MFYYDLSTRHTIDREVWHQEHQHATGEDHEDQQGSVACVMKVGQEGVRLLLLKGQGGLQPQQDTRHACSLQAAA